MSNTDEYISYAAARKCLQNAMNQMASKMVSEQITEHVKKLRAVLPPDGVLSDASLIGSIQTIIPKPSKEYLELARAVAVLWDAEMKANQHLMHPPST